MWRDGVRNEAERRRQRRKIWKGTLWVWNPCNPLKFHKTTKAFFGKAWRKTCEIWKSLEKVWSPPLFRHLVCPHKPRAAERIGRPPSKACRPGVFELAQVANQKVAEKGA
jgi:hypothetical protein